MRGLKIKGQFFTEPTNIDLFGSKVKNGDSEVDCEKQIVVLYGKNGSGKTTISNAFLSLACNNDESFELVDPFDLNGNNISAEDIGDIFVFNESFVNNNVTLSSDDGLNAIMLFGKSGEIDTKINVLLENIKSEEEKIHLKDIEKYHRKKDANCIEDVTETITDVLRNGWASREQVIKGNLKKSPVKVELINLLLNTHKPSETKKALDDKLKSLVNSIESVKNTNEKLESLLIKSPLKPIESYNELLRLSLSKKEMTEFAEVVLNSIQSTKSQYLELSKKVLSRKGVCPVCFQEVSAEHGLQTKEVINNIFDESIEKLKNSIREEKMELIQIPDFVKYSKNIAEDLINKLREKIVECNGAIAEINNSLELKIGSIYNPVPELNIDTDTLNIDFDALLNSFNNEINTFNDSIDKRDANISEASKTNIFIAYYECQKELERLVLLQNQEESDKKEIAESNKLINQYNEEINKLNAEKQNYSIALNEINKCLSFIFGTSKRLYLEPSNDGNKYYVLSKGRRIKAKKLSTGEKNIIAFVYYYESLKGKCNEGDYFKKKSVYVIDDPISSFDYENKIGMLSFIKRIVSEIQNGNSASQICLMTHEVEVASFLSRICNDLGLSGMVVYKELKNKSVICVNATKYTTYGALLFDAFEYVKGDNDNSISIGNTLRRILEAYTSFNYKETIDNFLSKEDYLSKLPTQELRDYFYSRMNRLLLHEESHSENAIRQIADTWNFDLFSEEEKVRTAKDILVLLYCLDEKHIERYLKIENMRFFRQWKEDIENSL